MLEAVTLTADVLELTANPNKEARGVAIEANLDKGRGAVSTVLVQSGTLRVGDAIVAGVAHGRVRAMFDENGQAVKEAGPSRPVQVLGLSTVPRAGDTFLSTEEERTARQIAEKREAADRNAQLAKRRKRVTLESFDAAVAEGKMDTLNLIIKGDVSGAVEALEESLMKIDAGGDEVQLRCGCYYPERREPGNRGQRGDHRLQRPPGRARGRAGRPRGCRDEVLLGHLPCD